MLNILGHARRTCGRWTRRQVLEAGGAGLLGLSLPKLLAAEAAQGAGGGRAKSVIFLFLFGGPSQLETFDLKPNAPSTIRGPFNPIRSRTSELKICEHLPRLAAISDRYCVVRTMTHPYNDHSSAGHYIQTGRPWHVPIGGGFNATEKDWPAHGSVADYLDTRSTAPRLATCRGSFICPTGWDTCRPTRRNSTGRGSMPAGWAAAMIRWPPPSASATTTTTRSFAIAVTRSSTIGSRAWRSTRGSRSIGSPDGARWSSNSIRRAATWTAVASRRPTINFASVRWRWSARRRFAAALDIHSEPAASRDRYGRHLFGQSTLVARRLVEAGTRFVTVAWDAPDGYSWDSHTSSDDVKNHLLPGFDQALAALLDDLSQRGLLDETLVVATGEMGRTPKGTDRWGRGHWSTLFSTVLAGAGIQGGRVYGTSDRDAAYALDHPTSPEDLAATIFERLGIDPHQRIHDPQGRPVPLVESGQVIREILA